MNCHEFEDWLNDVEHAGDHGMCLGHLAQCESAACRELWDEYLLVEDAVSRWKRDIPEVDVIDKVWSEIKPAVVARKPVAESTPEFHSQTSRSAWGALVMTAAIVALGLWGLSGFKTPVGNTSPPEMAIVPIVDPPRPEAPLQRYSVASVSLAQSASAFVADAALLTVRDVGDPNDPTRPVSAWATKMSQQLEPLGENFNHAIKYLDEVIPDMSDMRMIPTS